ncbi:MAG: heme exporter protein CcmB [Actinomycetota bacterium]
MKDLRSESRAKEIAPAMVMFALALVFLLSFTLPAVNTPEARDTTAAFLWASLLFAAITGFGQSASTEKEGSRIEGLLMAPVDPAALFMGKAISNFAYMIALEMVIVPVLLLFVDIAPGLLFPQIFAVAVAANIGMAAIGTLFGQASQYARARALILPLLAFPALLPVILGASKLTSSLLSSGTTASEARWFVLIGVYDLVFVTIGVVTFEFVISE